MEVKVLLIIIGMAVVTYLPRVLPIVSLSKIPLPRIVLRWLSFIPVAVLSALLFPSLVVTEGKLNLSFNNEFLLAAVPAFIIAFWKKSLVLTVVVGMVSLVLLNNII